MMIAGSCMFGCSAHITVDGMARESQTTEPELHLELMCSIGDQTHDPPTSRASIVSH